MEESKLDALETDTNGISDYSKSRPQANPKDRPVVRSKKEAALSQRKMLIVFTAVAVYLITCLVLGSLEVIPNWISLLMQLPIYIGVLIAYLRHSNANKGGR